MPVHHHDLVWVVNTPANWLLLLICHFIFIINFVLSVVLIDAIMIIMQVLGLSLESLLELP